MNEDVLDFWTPETSVFLTSFWGWSPETWGTVGFARAGRRTTILNSASDPFVAVAYVTSNKSYIDPSLKGMVAGFYLMSHEIGDRRDFTAPGHWNVDPEKWQYSIRALRAFSYLPEYRMNIRELDLSLIEGGRARSVAASGEFVTDPEKIARLRSTPFVEVPVYAPGFASGTGKTTASNGMVPGGPASEDGYIVAEGTASLPRDLYVARLEGDTDAYLGEPAGGRSIYKIGLSASPERRRQSFQKSMPKGAFQWKLLRTTRGEDHNAYPSHASALAGENAMKVLLAREAEWLNGEFYLASDDVIDAAWHIGRTAALAAMEND